MENSSEPEYRHGKSDFPETTQPSSQSHASYSVNNNATSPPPSYNAHPNYYMDSTHAQATSYGHPYYLQPEPGYTGPAFVDSQGCQQPQQVSYMIPQAPVYVRAVPVASVSMAGAIGLSCFVYFCCGAVCGGIAFILAMVGQSSADAGDVQGALQMRKASYVLSIAGIVTGIITIIIVVALYAAAYSSTIQKERFYNG